jgi:hypothetical protein
MAVKDSGPKKARLVEFDSRLLGASQRKFRKPAIEPPPTVPTAIVGRAIVDIAIVDVNV